MFLMVFSLSSGKEEGFSYRRRRIEEREFVVHLSEEALSSKSSSNERRATDFGMTTFRIFRQTNERRKNGAKNVIDAMKGVVRYSSAKTKTTAGVVVYSTSSFSFSSSFCVLFVFLLCAVVTFLIVLNHPPTAKPTAVGPREGT